MNQSINQSINESMKKKRMKVSESGWWLMSGVASKPRQYPIN